MGIEPLPAINELLPLVMFYPHKIVDYKKKKRSKKRKGSNSSLFSSIITIQT